MDEEEEDDYDFEDDFESDDEQDLYVSFLYSVQCTVSLDSIDVTLHICFCSGGWRWRCWRWYITCWHMVGQGSIGFGRAGLSIIR